VKEELAEQLLGRILDWDTPTAKVEISELRYLAAVKYDGYRNFEPGHRFMESLVLWLRNFTTVEEKRIAYDFIKQRMLYISETQMDHLVGLLYPQRIIPILIDQAVKHQGVSKYKIRQIRDSEFFAITKRKTLFLGMSDGARMDAFRRKNALSNEQVCVSLELSEKKIERLHEELSGWLEKIGYKGEKYFESIFLVDDFSGSGDSILREEDGILKGKLFKFFDEFLADDKKFRSLFGDKTANIFVVTYIATQKATLNLSRNLDKLIKQKCTEKLNCCRVLEPLQLLDSEVMLPQDNCNIDQAFDILLKKYYDPRLHDDNTEKGGPDVIHGYANCSLPLVLCHNCPNNSVYLLWGSTPKCDGYQGLNALFPRVSRHLEGR
jgi:hypothetical protein